MSPLGVVRDGALVIIDGVVRWVGADHELPGEHAGLPELDAGGAAVVPGFVDAHTHAVWAGSRREEFLARMRGERYDGGGIVTTVAATAEASDEELLALASGRLRSALTNGTTTLEVKTGYGLHPEAELRLLDVITALADRAHQHVEPTYLVHVPPPAVDRTEHVAATAAALPEAAMRGARWCDVFCDAGAFSVEEARLLLRAAAAAGLGLRLHAEQLSRTGAANLAAESGCASADHLEHVDRGGAAAMAAAGTVGVLLPTATLSTRGSAWETAQVLREAGVTLALGTDCNPGTSWCESMPYAIQLACLLLGLSVEEAFAAATRGSARALRLDDAGHLSPGARGDVVLLDAEHEADVVAHLGAPAVRTTVIAGRIAHDNR